MKKLLYSAIDTEGRAISNFIESHTIKEAILLLELKGFGNIIFYNDPYSAGDRDDLANLSDNELKNIAAFEIKSRKKNRLINNLAETIKRNFWFYLMLLLIVIVAAYQARKMTVIFIIVVASIPLLTSTWRYRLVYYYNEMLKANAVGNWLKVITLGTKLKTLSEFKQVTCEIDFQIAKALIAQGKKDSALTLVAKWKTHLNHSAPGLYESGVSNLYAQAHDYSAYLDLQKKSYQLSLNDISAVDLAMAEVRFGSKEAANDLIKNIDTKNLSQVAILFAAWTKGLLLADNNPQKSLHHLKEVVDGMTEMTDNPTSWVINALCSADYAIQLYGSGQFHLAQKTIEPFLHIIKIHADPVVNSKCNKIVSDAQ